jgi:two-component system cell cycle sensor histidine kinase/response regulator CckA
MEGSPVSDRVSELEAELSRLRAERDTLARELARADVYRQALNSAPVGVMCNSVKTGQYVFSNPAHAGFLGCTPEEIVAGDPHQRWMEITHPEDFERELGDHQRLARGEIASFESERRCVRSDGHVRWARVTVVGVRDADDRLEYIYVYFVDIHEHRAAVEAQERLETQLRQSQKLEALGRLAGGVAHDFNNRLLIIMGYTEVLKSGMAPNSPEAQQADMVLTSAQRAAELTRQLLAYSRRQVLEPQAFDLNETVDSMRRLLERLIGEDILLETQLSADHPVFSDPGQIEQVVLNLAINARDAMPRGGRLQLETRDATIAADLDQNLPAGDYVALLVRDTGTGIPEHVLPRIFEPFFTTKDVGAGTGLGLATVEGIVRQSGGSVHVESSLERGTTFTVYLPRACGTKPRVALSSAAPLPRAAQFETLLVCDDDDAVRDLLVNLLRVRAYHVLEARNGRHALEVARAHGKKIDVLITDLVMPEMSGTELASALRKEQAEVEILYVSGYTEDEAVLRGSLGPRAHFLAKPFLPGELVRAVLGIVEGSRRLTPEESREANGRRRP